ncbi:hypothetical protein LPJ38_31270 [Bradyrhizobium daqingense]|uniref:hypothetical protein n=1 Tax=Bradyrhizobium daqingense TaxID=993502 RepID=UPI0013152A24|nr:hypothetical protein [Bradyrhizobium daqingense]UFS88073.1 hypothetical protein LPJ38_31270 [Bradyrhizobium daqingense]
MQYRRVLIGDGWSSFGHTKDALTAGNTQIDSAVAATDSSCLDTAVATFNA